MTKRENWLFVDKLLECETTEDLQVMGARTSGSSLDWQLKSTSQRGGGGMMIFKAL